MLSDSSGNEVAGSRTRHLPFGGWRGTAPTQTVTDRAFTGQKENMELGLLYFNARYYLPNTNRFVSADTIVPDPANPQSFNRYSYVENNPVNFTDPTGHRECGADCNDPLPHSDIPWVAPVTSPFFNFVGGITREEKQMAHQAASAIGQRIASTVNPLRRMEAKIDGTIYTPLSAEEAFLGVFGGPITLVNVNQYLVDNSGRDVYAIASETEAMITIGIKQINNHYLFVHEIFHLFDLVVLGGAANQTLLDIQRQTANTANPFPDRPNLNGPSDLRWGFAGGNLSEWQKSSNGASGEEFADMGIGWTYNRWDADADGLTDAGQARANFMDIRMASWLSLEIP